MSLRAPIQSIPWRSTAFPRRYASFEVTTGKSVSSFVHRMNLASASLLFLGILSKKKVAIGLAGNSSLNPLTHASMRDGSTSTLMNDCVPAPIVRRSPANESNKNRTRTFLIRDFIVRRLPKLLAFVFERVRPVTMTSSWTCSRSFMHVRGVKKAAGWTGVTLHNNWCGPVLRTSIGRPKYYLHIISPTRPRRPSGNSSDQIF